MIRYLKQEEKTRSRALWELAFTEDSKSFVDFYYMEKSRRNKLLAAEEDGEVIAMLHRNPYDVVVKDRIWKVDYIGGVATHPKWRHRGHMRKLLTRCFQDMYMEKMEFCFLIPANPAIYLPFDFTYIYDRPQRVINEKGMMRLNGRALTEHSQECEEAALFVGKQLEKQYEVYTKRDTEYYNSLCREVRSADGDLVLLRTRTEREKLVGVSAYYGDDGAEQRELICLPEYLQELVPPKPLVMGRIIHLESFVTVIRLKAESEVNEMELLIEVEDSQIHQNNGIFCWRLDKKGSSIARADQNSSIRPHVSLGISEMTSWLFGYQKPIVPENRQAMINRIRPLKGVCLEEIV